MSDTNHKTMDWAFWFYWIMATTLGWLIGNIFFRGLPVIFSGVIISALQWSVLYKRIQKAWRWILFSSLGWIGGNILFVVFIPTMNFLLGPLLGGVVGVMQWFMLRTEFDWAGWWPIISVLAWTTGLTLIPGSLTSGSLPGALTGLTLMILFRFSYKNRQKGMEN
jgi:hypothetical protein